MFALPTVFYLRRVQAKQSLPQFRTGDHKITQASCRLLVRLVLPPRSPGKVFPATPHYLLPSNRPDLPTFPRPALFYLRGGQGPAVAADSDGLVKVTAAESPVTLSVKFPAGNSLTLRDRHLECVIERGSEMQDVDPEFLWTNTPNKSSPSLKI
ncbi:hypothetical protein C8J57DRAFT_1476320 [Mycena rebaudengoi]|nr:hypothetical protein C8J57DRAFT_1476320 [Mycena rebaudengoi]